MNSPSPTKGFIDETKPSADTRRSFPVEKLHSPGEGVNRFVRREKSAPALEVHSRSPADSARRRRTAMTRSSGKGRERDSDALQSLNEQLSSPTANITKELFLMEPDEQLDVFEVLDEIAEIGDLSLLAPEDDSSSTEDISVVDMRIDDRPLFDRRISQVKASDELVGESPPARPPLQRNRTGRNRNASRRKALTIDQYGFKQNSFQKGNFSPELQMLSDDTERHTIRSSRILFPSRPTIQTWEAYLASIQDDWNNLKRSDTLKNLITQIGIPPNLRGRIWPLLTSARKLQQENPTRYKELLAKLVGEPNPYHEQIEKDLHRTFPHNVWFTVGEVQNSLRHILGAFSKLKPDIGYCQAMNFVAGMLLLFVAEEDAFWMIASVIDELLPADYYSTTLYGVKVDVEAFRIVFKEKIPKLTKHFATLGLDVGMFVTRWFMCLFINLLPTETAMRFLDAFFYEGGKMLFRVALALFLMHQNTLLQITDMAKLMLLCNSLPESANDPTVLMRSACDRSLDFLNDRKIKEYRSAAAKVIQAKKEAREKEMREKEEKAKEKEMREKEEKAKEKEIREKEEKAKEKEKEKEKENPLPPASSDQKQH